GERPLERLEERRLAGGRVLRLDLPDDAPQHALREGAVVQALRRELVRGLRLVAPLRGGPVQALEDDVPARRLGGRVRVLVAEVVLQAPEEPRSEPGAACPIERRERVLLDEAAGEELLRAIRGLLRGGAAAADERVHRKPVRLAQGRERPSPIGRELPGAYDVGP